MKQKNDFPYSYREVEHTWIPMPDETRLASRMWIPESAEERPVPAIFEYIPYRLRDFKRIRDEINHRYFAGHGYAVVRVDIRGSGDSEGILKDEYLEQELKDGEEVIKWIADQTWCNGYVGMIGISWGGFNGLQLAARRPEALKAIITVCSTDDRYADDVHYMGGCLLGDNLSWASVMFGRNSLPPDPQIVGDKWREMWFDRLSGSGLWLKNWLEHQRRDDYWKHGSVCENYQDIDCPVMAVSGWADGYSNSVFRILEHLDVPRMGLVGPWSHRFPHDGIPGPAIGFLQESIRWWDRWLKGADTGIDREPMLKAWVQESMPPATSYEKRPGYWLGLNEWPSDAVNHESLYLTADYGLSPSPGRDKNNSFWVQSPLALGMFAGKWCSYSAPPDLPGDQREEDGGALVFNSPPLPETREIVGAPVADFMVMADRPSAMIAVRLSDVSEDGKVTRVTFGVFNLTHREGHEHPVSLEPGTAYRIRFKLNDIAHIFPAGHRIRVSISSSYFPMAWPSPEHTMLEIHGADNHVLLPMKIREGDAAVSFGQAESAVPGTHHTVLAAPDHSWNVIKDLIHNDTTLEVIKDGGVTYLREIDLAIGEYNEERYRIRNDLPGSARGETYWHKSMKRGEWEISTETRTVLTSDEEAFYIHATLDAYEGEKRVFSRIWDERIGRKGV